MKSRFYLALLLIVVVFSALIYFMSADNSMINRSVCLMGNAIFAGLAALVYGLSVQKINSKTPSKFVFGFLGITMLRLFFSIAVIIAFVLVFKKSIHKLNYFILLFQYVVYTLIETAFVMKANKVNSGGI